MRNKVSDEEIEELLLLSAILPAVTQEVLVLYHRQNKTLKEICPIIGKSMCVVSNHYHRGLFLLRRHKEQMDQSGL